MHWNADGAAVCKLLIHRPVVPAQAGTQRREHGTYKQAVYKSKITVRTESARRALSKARSRYAIQTEGYRRGDAEDEMTTERGRSGVTKSDRAKQKPSPSFDGEGYAE